MSVAVKNAVEKMTEGSSYSTEKPKYSDEETQTLNDNVKPEAEKIQNR